MSKRKQGTRAGVPNREYEVVRERLARCPAEKCGSTRRTVVRKVSENATGGVDPESGRPYSHIVRRIVRCDECGQHYAVATYENREAAKVSSG